MPAGPFNVLFIIDDQHRADCLGYMGSPWALTPNLDALAARSVVFTNAFAQTPACMASRASILTGRYPSSVRVRGMNILPPQETTTAHLLQQAGYHTGAIGKLHLTPQLYTRDRLGLDAPCLDWRRFADDAVLSPFPDLPGREQYGFMEHFGCDDALKGNHRRWALAQAPELADAKPVCPMPEVSKETYVSEYPTALHHAGYVGHHTQDFIQRQQGTGKPWYAWCGFVGPHHPFEAPAEQIARYDGIDIPDMAAPPMTTPMTHEDGLIPEPASDAIGEAASRPRAYRDLVTKHYLAAISTIDDRIGAILQTLRETGQDENTIIVFCADHGEMLWAHGLLRKPSLSFDQTLRVPLLMRIPGVAPRRIDDLVELVDLHPTLMSLTGQPINPGVQGIDWSDALRNGSPVGREDIYSEMGSLKPMVFGKLHGPYMPAVTLRTKQWKINLYPTAGPQYGQLFDLENDPGETHNLYASPQHATRRHEMTWRLLQRQFDNADPLPLRLTQW